MEFGDKSNLNGWNPNFRYDSNTVYSQEALKYACFPLEMDDGIARIGSFKKWPVLGQTQIAGGGGDPNEFDHQGHIYPQNLMIGPLTSIARAASNEPSPPETLEQLNTFLSKQGYKDYNFDMVTAYVKYLIKKGAPELAFVDGAASKEDKYDGYFSVCIWNPFNICRAPEDKYRNGRPGKNIDWVVVDKIKSMYKEAQGNGASILKCFEAFGTPGKTNGPKNIIGALNSLFSILVNDQQAGYYRFYWTQSPLE